MRQIPPMDRIPLFMWTTLEGQYHHLYPHPPQAMTLADMEMISVWYIRLHDWRQRQAEQVLQIKPGWSAPLIMDNAVAVACVLFGVLRGTSFLEVCAWPGRREPEVLALHLPMSHQALLVDDIPYGEMFAKALLGDYLLQNGTASCRHILLRHDYRIVFEEQRVCFLSASSVSLTYEMTRREPSMQEWWWYTR
jgi:hypothetical protein